MITSIISRVSFIALLNILLYSQNYHAFPSHSMKSCHLNNFHQSSHLYMNLFPKRTLPTICIIIASQFISTTMNIDGILPIRCSIANDINLRTELEEYEEKTEYENYKQAREPKSVIRGLNDKLSKASRASDRILPKDVDLAVEKVLTLQAYLDEAERDLFERNWDNLQVYLYTFAEQEDAFAILIDCLFPSTDELDTSTREALSYEAKAMFLALDDLREAAIDKKFKFASNAYAKLLLAYDHFLKAGNLYPTYDAITSTEIFYANTPRNTLKFDSKVKVQVLDEIVLTSGPDMGKSGTVIYIDGDQAVVKLDKDGKAYQEVKYVKYNSLAKADIENTSKEFLRNKSKLKKITNPSS